jgi:hypothetical protein
VSIYARGQRFRGLLGQMYGVQVVAGSNPVAPIQREWPCSAFGVRCRAIDLWEDQISTTNAQIRGQEGKELLTLQEIKGLYPDNWVLITPTRRAG